MEYVVLFFSHFGAVRFHRDYKGVFRDAHLMPVPRSLSSSCGTCVAFTAHGDMPEISHELYEIEGIVEKNDTGYTYIYKADG